MRIGLVTGEYPPMQGGVGAFTREIARAMVSQGHSVQVITRQGAGDAADGINVMAGVGRKWGWHTLRVVADWARSANLDVVNLQFQTAAFDMHPAVHWLPSSLSEIPVIVTFHDLRFPYLFPKAGPLRNWIVRRLAVSADGVIATDRTDAKRLSVDWQINNVCWVPIGSNISTLPPSNYDSAAWRQSMGVASDNLLVSYFGFLNESKGALILIQAVKQLATIGVPVHLVMIGGRAGASDPTDVAYGLRIDEAIREAGINHRVYWTGFVDDAQVSAYLYASDITALPYRDGVSLRRGTLMAALAHGRAIITTTPTTESPELVGAVEIVPPDNAEALAIAIHQLWRDPARRATLEKAAGDTSANFTWEQIASRTVDYYRSVVNQ